MMTTTTTTTRQQTTSNMRAIDGKSVDGPRSQPTEHARPPVIEATGGYAHESALSIYKTESKERRKESQRPADVQFLQASDGSAGLSPVKAPDDKGSSGLSAAPAGLFLGIPDHSSSSGRRSAC